MLFQDFWESVFPGKRMRWNEPLLFGIRLHNRQGRLLTLFFAVAISMAAASCFLVSSPIEFIAAVVVGLVSGFFVCFVYAYREAYRKGTVIIHDSVLQHKTFYASFDYTVTRTDSWPYAAISHCGIVSHVDSGLPYSMLAIYVDDEIKVMGVPKKVDLQRLTSELERHGLVVTPLRSIRGYEPRESVPISVFQFGTVAITLPLLIGGFIVELRENANNPAAAGPNQNAQPPFAVAPLQPQRPGLPFHGAGKQGFPDPIPDPPAPPVPPPAVVPFWPDDEPDKADDFPPRPAFAAPAPPALKPPMAPLPRAADINPARRKAD